MQSLRFAAVFTGARLIAHKEAGRHVQRLVIRSPGQCISVARIELVPALFLNQQPTIFPLLARRFHKEVHAFPGLVVPAGQVKRVVGTTDQHRVGGLAEGFNLRPLRCVTGPQATTVLQARVMPPDDHVQVALAVHNDCGPRMVVAAFAQGVGGRPVARFVIQAAYPGEVAFFGGVLPDNARLAAGGNDLIAVSRRGPFAADGRNLFAMSLRHIFGHARQRLQGQSCARHQQANDESSHNGSPRRMRD